MCLLINGYVAHIYRIEDLMKTRIKKIIESTETSQGRVFAFTVQILIVISLVTFSINTLPNLSNSTREVLQAIEILTVTVFTIEYLLRISVSDNKFGFIFSFFGIIDLMAILPFYM